ncbi:MAG: IS1380 family transposase [Gammaproteobacteria bacterium]|nr:IS1380 family transposase [Gammaproteobacteria bacterium]MYH45051.1 IS1380 family transposase [Gammaproteobacteria bacterium]MYL13919.1 IS1380 family transposase [Gammaproteobacteria bacterium]
MTNCNPKPIRFANCKGRLMEAGFSGGDITSDGGAVLLRAADRMLGLTDSAARALGGPRRQASCLHSLPTMVRQRVYALALGYEDLNDHDELRSDPALQTAVGADAVLAGASTLCRFERRMGREDAVRLHEVLIEQFIASFKRPPRKRLVLDFDATDDPAHGMQEGRFFHGYYDRYCFLPLYVFCGGRLLVAYLRPGNSDGARHAWAVLALLTKRLRQAWPKVKIVFRGDGGFCRPRMLSWCERNDVGYIVGIGRNAALAKKAKPIMDLAELAHEASGEDLRLFEGFRYAAGTWKRLRRVVVKAEHSARGANPRFIVTNLKGVPQWLYEKMYCARGDMENRIKEQQLDLFADRTSCHESGPNQYRMLLSALAYTLLEAIRRVALAGSELANAYVGTIRLKLLKIGAVVLRNTRRVRLLLSGSCPRQALFRTAAVRLKPG